MKYRLLEISKKDTYYPERKKLVGEIFENPLSIKNWGDSWFKVVGAEIDNKCYLFFEVRIEEVQ